jgi:hypothetical protein
MPVKCVTCGLLFRTGNDLDWHIREEHLRKETPPAKRTPVAAPAPLVSNAQGWSARVPYLVGMYQMRTRIGAGGARIGHWLWRVPTCSCVVR